MRLVICTVLLVSAAAAAGAQQRESANSVRDLYAAAAYEDALSAASRLQSASLEPEVEQYRVFSLFALGRLDEAEEAMKALIAADPLFVLDPADTPRRVHDAFQEVRENVLPEVVGRFYLDARAALDRKDRAAAIAGFERLVTIIDNAGTGAPSLGELRVLATGFLDLSRALAEAAQSASTAAAAAAAPPPAPTTTLPPVPVPVPAPAPAAVPAAATETRPVAIRQDIPPWTPSDSLMRKTAFSGAIRVHVGADGGVKAADVVRSVHPAYDEALLQSARGWLYQPATRNERPVEAEITVEVTLRPPK